jgi:hypothetical protein
LNDAKDADATKWFVSSSNIMMGSIVSTLVLVVEPCLLLFTKNDV